MKQPLDVILSEAKNLTIKLISRVAILRAVATLRMTILGMAIALLAVSCSQSNHQSPVTSHPAAKYHCPMHPTIVSDKPGDCSICGMRLVPMTDGEQPAQPATPKQKTMYRSTMNPNEVSDKPGKDSMGMEMVAFEVASGGAASRLPGLATISILPAARERMGLTLGVVEKRPLARELRTSARIVPDETKLYHVTLKVEGWVEHLHEIATGVFVKKGDPLLKIYSPDLVSAQQEYLTALAAVAKLAGDTGADAADGARRLLDATRQRLKLWDVTDEQIAELERRRTVEKDLMLAAPFTGWVIERNIAAGHKLLPGEMLLTLADLSRVWVEADIYESDLPYVKAGMPVELTLPYWPGQTFQGTVSLITSTLDPETRTAKARIEVPNPDLILKPEMFATARLQFDLGEKLAVPVNAVMRTGERVYAFRDAGDGKLEPVEIQIGARSNGYYEVAAGLQAGDRVVTSANFLVDSESSMKAALEALAGK